MDNLIVGLHQKGIVSIGFYIPWKKDIVFYTSIFVEKTLSLVLCRKKDIGLKNHDKKLNY